MFVEVLARVRGEPSAGHSPPAAPSHSDTVTKGDPQIVLYTSPPPQQGQTQRPGRAVLSLALPQEPTCSLVTTQTTKNQLLEMKGKCVILLLLVFL